MTTSYIITFIGDDRPGLVEDLAQVIADNNGNWLESRLSQLAGKFAGIIRVSLDGDNVSDFQQALENLTRKGLSVRVRQVDGERTAAGRVIVLTAIGPDRPGIVREISSALATHKLNVVEMDSRVSSAPMTAEQLFEAIIHIEVTATDAIDTLSDTLDEIANEMTLDIHLEES